MKHVEVDYAPDILIGTNDYPAVVKWWLYNHSSKTSGKGILKADGQYLRSKGKNIAWKGMSHKGEKDLFYIVIDVRLMQHSCYGSCNLSLRNIRDLTLLKKIALKEKIFLTP